ncbi:pilus assembly PilX N-terminal domain-containing protein [Desulfosarcina sp. OttesenSCG-928-B08]|nr:pilus assembly PilX N-terminal domain-containing protein [Desulfosarcina sp. OttesenSCG-928-B08]
MLLVVLTIAGVMSITMSSNEGNIVRNEQISAAELYKAETGLNIARLQFMDWMTNDFMGKVPEHAEARETIYYADDPASKKYKKYTNTEWNANTPYTAKLQIRNIVDFEETPSDYTPVFGGGVADTIPPVPHFGTPPAGTGYSAKSFQVRRFSITVTTDNGAIVQAGVWKAFGKYNN